MPHIGHHHHHAHHAYAHHNVGGPAVVTASPRMMCFMRSAIFLGLLSILFLILGIVFTTSPSEITIGIIFLVVWALLVFMSVALCCWLRKLHQQAVVDHQHAGGRTIVVYGQPGTTPDIVQPQTPGASMTYGQPRMQPIIQTQTPGPANVMFRPGGGVMYLPDTQANLQPNVPRSPGASAHPQYPEAHPEAPPPAYEEVVKQHTDPGNMGND